MNLTYDTQIKPQYQKTIHGYMKELLWLVPGWVQYLTITLEDSDASTALASIRVNYKYRHAKMFIQSSWLNLDPGDQLETLIHELIHLYSALPTDYAGEKLGVFVVDEDMRKVIGQDLREREEQMTQDLTYAIYKKLYAEEYGD